ncbi:MAG: hypothetical protein A2161_00040 [Candidatus Schekmanbacteria bacterium RBG_13_48_7]|uniref:Galactose oxidase n=1 Tax=Candidatus Schekmanbacteria bacterium RBG_13_48_7 TaxID=1817878 RepID=A0A1F7RXW0_9BACT|nr:MAG: hypothetical protein A2161_00040 [Candidatus Schekmanbacteria bacterium RBG_13_48_7]
MLSRLSIYILAIGFLFLIPFNVYSQAWDWRELHPVSVPPGLSGNKGSLIGFNFYIFGGTDGVSLFNSLYYMDLRVPEWFFITPSGIDIPSSRYGHTMVRGIVDSEEVLLVFGGDDGLLQKDLWYYIVASNQWKQMAGATGDIPPEMKGHSANITIAGNMVVFGGELKASFSDELYIYSPLLNTWTLLTPITSHPFARSEHSAIIISENTSPELFIFGGTDGISIFDDVWSYNFGLNSWTKLDPTGDVPAGRFSHTAVYISSIHSMLVFGGNSGTVFNDAYLLDLSTLNWTAFTPSTLPDVRFEHVSVWDPVSVSYPRMVMHAGTSGSTFYSDTWELFLMPSTPTVTSTPKESPTSTFTPSQSPTPKPTVLTATYTLTPSSTPTIGSTTSTPTSTITSVSGTNTPTRTPVYTSTYTFTTSSSLEIPGEDSTGIIILFIFLSLFILLTRISFQR